ncbi:MAG: hypothetical protein KDB27_01015 [Planctomycetales bacterium]|nr:hypothetical protein [Planctomycetales bacterium]
MLRYTGIATLLILIVAGVPWYWQFTPYSGNELFLGIPLWFSVSVVVAAVVSVLTAIQFAVLWIDEQDETLTDDETGAA